MRNELDGALSTTLGAGKKAAPGLHSIRVEDAIVIHLTRGRSGVLLSKTST